VRHRPDGAVKSPPDDHVEVVGPLEPRAKLGTLERRRLGRRHVKVFRLPDDDGPQIRGGFLVGFPLPGG
jgi:hypothetical protein